MLKKATLLLFILSTLATMSMAQQDKSKRPSPPATAQATIGDINITINYNSPAVKGRTVWGGLVPFGQIWRTGANEATTFEVNKDVMVQGHLLPAGKYSFFTIPGEEEWILIFNKEPNQWGAYNYNEKMDALRVNAKAGSGPEFNERLTFDITTRDKVAFINLKWENLALGFSVLPAEK